VRSAPISRPTISTTVAGTIERDTAPRIGPTMSIGRGTGATSRRSNQPCSMSRARFDPAAAPAKPAPCRHESGTIQEM
jgi:hypothetical protein